MRVPPSRDTRIRGAQPAHPLITVAVTDSPSAARYCRRDPDVRPHASRPALACRSPRRDHHTSPALTAACVARRSSRLSAAGVLTPIRRGVFVVSVNANHDRAALRHPLCGSSVRFRDRSDGRDAAGLRRMPRTALLHFAVRHGHHHHHRRPGVQFRQTTALVASHRSVRRDGIVVASPDAARVRPRGRSPRRSTTFRFSSSLLHEQKVTVDELVAHRATTRPPSAPGQRAVPTQPRATRSASAPNESHPEVVLAEALRARGIPIENQTMLVRASNGRTARVDLAVPAIRWGIELDIHPEHRTFEGHANGARRAP